MYLLVQIYVSYSLRLARHYPIPSLVGCDEMRFSQKQKYSKQLYSTMGFKAKVALYLLPCLALGIITEDTASLAFSKQKMRIS